MKSTLTILISFVIILSSCKKDENDRKPLDEALISTTWLTTAEKHVYYNESISPLLEEDKRVGIRYVFNDESKTVNIRDLEGKVIQKTYSLFQINGKDFLNIISPSGTETFQITAYTNKTMSWRQEKTNQSFGDGKVAAKALITIDFHCPCRD